MGQNISKLKNNRNTSSQANLGMWLKVSSEKFAYKYVKTALLLLNVIDGDHQNSCLFTNRGHFLLPLWVLIGVLAKFHQ